MEVSYSYNTAGNLVAFTDIGGAVTRFVYDNDRLLTEIIDPRGVRVARNIYDENGRHIATIDAAGNEIRFDNDIDGRRSVITDRLGFSTVYHYDERGNITKTIDANGNVTHATFDNRDRRLTETDALGNVTQFTFGNNHDNPLSVINALGNQIIYFYNAQNQATSVRVDGRVLASLIYNTRGQLTETTDVKLIRETLLDENHPDIAAACNNMALMYDELGNYKKALELYEIA